MKKKIIIIMISFLWVVETNSVYANITDDFNAPVTIDKSSELKTISDPVKVDFFNNRPKYSRIVLTSSIVVFSIFYSGTLIGDYFVNKNIDFPEIFVPAIGPLIAAFRADSFSRRDYWPSQEGEKILYAFSSIIQTIAIVNFSIELYQRQKNSSILHENFSDPYEPYRSLQSSSYQHRSQKAPTETLQSLQVQLLGMIGAEIIYHH